MEEALITQGSYKLGGGGGVLHSDLSNSQIYTNLNI